MVVRWAAFCVLLPFLAWCASDDFDSLRQQAEQALQAHDVAKACDYYGRALSLKPDWPDGWWAFGDLLFVSGQYAKAEDALHRFTDLRPDAAEGWAMRGMAALQNHSYADALHFVEESLSRKFDMIPTLKSLMLTNHAFLLAKAGRFEDSLEALGPFIHPNPQPELLNALGVVGLRRAAVPTEVPASDRPLMEAAGQVEYELISNDPQATKSAEELTRDYPQKPGVHYLAGMVYFAQQPERAKPEFERELQISPKNAAAQSMLAYCDFALHRTSQQDVEQARAAVADDPNNAGFQYVLGMVCDAEGDKVDALAALKRASESKPDNVEYHVALAIAYSKADQFTQATAERERALSLKFGHGS